MASKYEKQASKYLDPLEKEAQAENKKRWQEKAQDTRKIYDNEIFEAGRAYEDQYRDNAVQKAINERQVAESMANMGLTDSGLNRTQLTAINLSAANNKAAIDRARQQAMSNIELQKTSDLSTIRQGYLSDKATIKQNYDEAKANYAGELETAAAKKYASKIKLENDNPKGSILNNGATIDRNMQGTLWSNGIEVTAQKDSLGTITGYKYYDRNSKKTTVYPVGTNPFTGDDNTVSKSDTGKAYAEHGAFENGYQPKGVFYNGKDYGLVSFSGIRDTINGNEQNVHKTADGSLWIWDRTQNKYRPYEQ